MAARVVSIPLVVVLRFRASRYVRTPVHSRLDLSPFYQRAGLVTCWQFLSSPPLQAVSNPVCALPRNSAHIGGCVSFHADAEKMGMVLGMLQRHHRGPVLFALTQSAYSRRFPVFG